MSKRHSGFARRAHDLYETPEWVLIEGLEPFYSLKDKVVIEPACGRRAQLVTASRRVGASLVIASDIKKPRTGWPSLRASKWSMRNFLTDDFPREYAGADFLMTNPPYGESNETAVAFIERALEWLALGDDSDNRTVAMLLPIDFDAAKSRRHLFEDCAVFEAQIVIRRRIKWFDRPDGKGRPSTHHAWFIWSNRGRHSQEYPIKLYACGFGAGDDDG